MNQKQLCEDIILLTLGLFCVGMTHFVLDVVFGGIIFFGGLASALTGGIMVFFDLNGGAKAALERFRKSKTGVAWIWAVAALALVLNVFVYVPLSYAWDQVSATILGEYTLTGDLASAQTAVTFIIQYCLVFGLVFTVYWVIVKAKASQFDPMAGAP